MTRISDNARGAALMTAAMAAFVLNDSCMKAVSQHLSLYQAILLRGLLTTAGLVLIAPRIGRLDLRLPSVDARALTLRTLAEIAGTVTFLTALTHMPLATLSAIMQALPIAVTLAAALVYGERLSARRLMASLAGLAGVLLIIQPGTAGFDGWAILGLGSVAAVVLRDLATRRLSAAVSSVTVAFLASVSVTLFAALALPFEPWRPIGATALALVATASVFLLSGHLLIVAAARVGDVGAVAPFRYTALVFAILLGWLSFGHLPDVLTLAGAAIVVLGGLLALSGGRRAAGRVRAQRDAGSRAS